MSEESVGFVKTKYFNIDGEIEYRLKSKEEKLEIKRDQRFYTLEYK